MASNAGDWNVGNKALKDVLVQYVAINKDDKKSNVDLIEKVRFRKLSESFIFLFHFQFQFVKQELINAMKKEPKGGELFSILYRVIRPTHNHTVCPKKCTVV